MRRIAVLVGALGLGGVVGTGCEDDEEGYDEVVAGDVDAAVASADYDADLAYGMTASLDDEFYDDYYAGDEFLLSAASRRAPLTARELVDTVTQYFTPSSCVSVTADDSTATAVLDDCDTELGLEDISGTLTATFTQPNAVNIVSNGLQIEGRSLDLDLDAVGSREGSTRVLTITSTATLRGSEGTLSRSGESELRWLPGSGCISLSSEASLLADGVAYTSELSGYERCLDECPSAGTFVLQGPGGTVFTVTFDGTDDPSILGSDGRRIDSLSLSCEEPE